MTRYHDDLAPLHVGIVRRCGGSDQEQLRMRVLVQAERLHGGLPLAVLLTPHACCQRGMSPEITSFCDYPAIVLKDWHDAELVGQALRLRGMNVVVAGTEAQWSMWDAVASWRTLVKSDPTNPLAREAAAKLARHDAACGKTSLYGYAERIEQVAATAVAQNSGDIS